MSLIGPAGGRLRRPLRGKKCNLMKKLIVANWKCNPSNVKQAQKMLAVLRAGVKRSKFEVVICPPFPFLFLGRGLVLGAQNCFWENPPDRGGAFTGEVSPVMLKSLGVKYVILGHSERVMQMGETNAMTAKKVKAALTAGLTPIVCVGETSEEKEQGKTFQIIEKELKERLSSVKKQDISKIIIAYEPLWAIGTGKNCSPDDAITVALYIKKLSKGKARVLYGGSVRSENARYYLSSDWLSGLLIGSASLDTTDFLKICKNI